jgi:hypothetical protein
MKKKLKLAFEQLEKEINKVSLREQTSIKGGSRRDTNGNIILKLLVREM